MEKNEIDEQAEAHWVFIEGLLKAARAVVSMRLLEYIFKTAFIHGYKHGRDDHIKRGD